MELLEVWKKLTAYPGSSDFLESTKVFSPYQKSSLTKRIILLTNEKLLSLQQAYLNGQAQTHNLHPSDKGRKYYAGASDKKQL